MTDTKLSADRANGPIELLLITDNDNNSLRINDAPVRAPF